MDFLINNIVWMTYLFTRVDEVKDAISAFSVMLFIIVAISMLILGGAALIGLDPDNKKNCEDREKLNEKAEAIKETLRRICKWGGVVWILVCTLNLLIPPKNDLALIAGVSLGAQVTKSVVESPTAKKAMALLETKIDIALQDAQEKLGVKKGDSNDAKQQPQPETKGK